MMVVKDDIKVEDERFRRRLKLIVTRTLPIVMAAGTMWLSNCGGEDPKNTESKQERYREVTTVDGRRPDGLSQVDLGRFLDSLPEREVVSTLFAKSAYLESAAVVAFEYLARELEAYQAPNSLIDVAYEAVEEEKEHARLMAQLVSHFGSAVIPEVEVTPFELRPLHEIAFENSLEGCTRETYGALKALWQSEVAEDEFVKEVTGTVGHDESRHAALSWAINSWIRPQLTNDQNRTCDRIQEEALEELRVETSRPVHPALIRWAGYPSPNTAKLLLQDSLSV